jgi:hypothetical protein
VPCETRARAKGQKGRALLDAPEMQRPVVEAVAIQAAPGADHRHVGQLVLEDRQQRPALILVEGAERVVQHNPAGPVQHEAREGQALPLRQGQALVPPLLAIECEQQMTKPDPRERGSDGRVIEALGWAG